VKVDSAGGTINLPTVEDMILRKILWYREGGFVSERRWRDFVQTIRLKPGLYNVYVDQISGRTGSMSRRPWPRP